MAKTQLNVRVDETTAEAARQRALQRGMSVNRYIEELVKQDAGEVGRTFVEAASDFMKQYESVFAEEFGEFGTDAGTGSAEGTGKASGTGAGREGKR
ncbi:antitoxin [Streptomyces lunaelactis]|uniref:antitoxin n=1 Tax=Streptomyces lunaelactis TaxID=1535768 RepID=UPI002815AC99|nr:antitoxin [Streptomyces lunaelactis]